MSVHAVSWVFQHSEERLGCRLVLLVLADHAKKDGSFAWPSVETISSEARMSERQVRRCLKEMAARGSVTEAGVSKTGTTIWHLRMDNLSSTRGDILSPELSTTLSPSNEGSSAGGDNMSPPARVPKKQIDELWDAVEGAGMKAPPTANKSARSSFAQIVRGLAEMQVTPAEVKSRAAAYRKHETLGKTMLTLPALSKWWNQLEATTKRRGQAPCSECGVGGGLHLADCPAACKIPPSPLESCHDHY